MKFLRALIERQKPYFEEGGALARFYPLFEAGESFLFSTGKVTRQATHVRDGVDLKRIMITVVVALAPCVLMALYNTGYQALVAVAAHPGLTLYGWQGALYTSLGFSPEPGNILHCMFLGALYFFPVLLVTFVAGGTAEAVFAIVRRHEINEGFLVTGMLIPLIVPPTIPLWQVALGTVFGVVFAKEIFGGTGMNLFNPALTSRAFLFFAYPAQISGDRCWTAVEAAQQVDGYSGATALARINEASAATAHAAEQALSAMPLSWLDAFLGFTPGCMGETSTLACLLGALVLIFTGVGSWRIMLGAVLGTVAMALLMNAAGSESRAMIGLPFWWHMVIGGWAFGVTFMATDPVTAPFTDKGRWLYGFLIGGLIVLIRSVNPAYPEGVMLAILFMNLVSPLIDWVAIQANIRRRAARCGSI